MNSISFLLKQVLKNKLAYLPWVLILVACLGTLFLNDNAYKQNGRLAQVREGLAVNTVKLNEYREELKTLEEGSEKYFYTQATIEEGERFIALDRQLLETIEDKNWDSLYDMEIANNQRLLNTFSKETSTDKLLLNALNRDLLMYKHLAELDIPYEDAIFPTTVTQFILSLFRYILPALLPVGLAYVLTNLYGSAYEGKLDKNRLLPQSLISITGKNILVGSLYSLMSLLAVLGPVALISGLLYGWGNLNYPILFYSLTTKEMFFSAIGQVILPTIILHALSLVFMTVLIYLITILTKNKMTALFISTIVLLSGIALPSVLAPVSAVAHLIPTTYVRSFDITTGVFQHGIENFQVNTGLGIGVLLISTVALVLLCLLAQKPKNNLMLTA